MLRCLTALNLCRAFLLAAGVAVGVHAQEIGPPNGTLVAVGGRLSDLGILERFLELAGGPDAPVVVIPTAGTGTHYGEYWSGLQQLRDAGATNLSVLHTRDRNEANSDKFARRLRKARGVWFSGGRQWRLADSYLDTKVHQELRALLERGGVIGGTSAGATIQGSYLARGDSKTNTIMMGDHEKGLGFLRNVAIDQHLLKRNRQFDLIEVIEAHPEVLGIGLDENTAIVVSGDQFEVLGQSYVVIYDHNRQLSNGGRFYFLAPGDRFNLKTREPFRLSFSKEAFEHLSEEPWPER